MNIGTRKQLFIDDRFIDSADGVTLCVNAPVQHPDPVLVGDRPWEALGIGAYNTVFREADGRFRMWYDAGMKGGLPSEGARRLGYAESDDGLHWEKPSLGVITFRGSTDNNLVAPHMERQSLQGATVFRDERAPEEERYRLWTKFLPTIEQREAGVGAGLWAMHSPDGIHWTEYPGQPNPPGQMCDTQNMFFWDDRVQQYVGYTRVRETQIRDEAALAEGKGRYRTIGRITSPDFRTWSETAIVLEADDEDLASPVPFQRDDPRPNIDFYTSCAMKYGDAQDVYLMFPSAFYHWGEDDYPAAMDTQLLTSRDGIKWRRAGAREPFLRLGADGSLRSGMIFANPWLIPMGDELWLYYVGTARSHAAGDDTQGRRNGIFRATLRRDGFVSADAGYGGGEITTPVLQFGGNRLELNCDGSAGGWLKVEIQDANGQAIAGYGLSDADTVRGNAIRKVVAWGGNSSLDDVVGRPVRLRIVMRGMKLYAFQFTQCDG